MTYLIFKLGLGSQASEHLVSSSLCLFLNELLLLLDKSGTHFVFQLLLLQLKFFPFDLHGLLPFLHLLASFFSFNSLLLFHLSLDLLFLLKL